MKIFVNFVTVETIIYIIKEGHGKSEARMNEIATLHFILKPYHNKIRTLPTPTPVNIYYYLLTPKYSVNPMFRDSQRIAANNGLSASKTICARTKVKLEKIMRFLLSAAPPFGCDLLPTNWQ